MKFAKRLLRPLVYNEGRALRLLGVANAALIPMLRRRVMPGSVLHVSYMVHIPFHTTRLLRRQGLKADYLAIGRSAYWNAADFVFEPSQFPFVRVLQEAWMFWSVMARYEIVHAHFGMTISRTGWELPVLKRLGRRLVVHFRGCEARDRVTNMRLHPDNNICTECDHVPPICESLSARQRREWAQRYADAVLVTTPDMQDFFPEATHVPFLAPELSPPAVTRKAEPDEFVVVHITSQPGIEGTRHVQAAIERLRAKGHRICLLWLRDRPHDEVLAAAAGADLAVGKMKMGYYANAQIETMALGIPTITNVRPAFMTEELRQSGFIFATPATLEATIEYYLTHPEALAEKRARARSSILRLHDNAALVQQLAGLYAGLKPRPPDTDGRELVC